VLGNIEIVGAFKFENKIYLCVSRLLPDLPLYRLPAV
jgi:hypothetical protein